MRRTLALFALMLGMYSAASAITLTSIDRINEYLELRSDEIASDLNKGKNPYE